MPRQTRRAQPANEVRCLKVLDNTFQAGDSVAVNLDQDEWEKLRRCIIEAAEILLRMSAKEKR